MTSRLFSYRHHLVKQVVGAAFMAMALALTAANAHAQSTCQLVVGHYVEHAVQQGCQSPAGLCIAGEYSGVIKGAFEGIATSLVPTADTPASSVLLFTSDSVIHASVGTKLGDLFVKNAGAFRTVGSGDIVDLQVITGGSGALAGASGVLRASGTFDSTTGSGASDYIGSICLP